MCEVLSYRATIKWFLPALAARLRVGDAIAQREFVRPNDTARRRVLKVTPTQTIGFDGNKMRSATVAAKEAGRV